MFIIMAFCFQDKKSDSTRGRKSLDIKHDGIPGAVSHRQDKISTLLQAAAAAAGNQNANAPKSPFGGLMSPNLSYMSSLAPYYGLQQGITPSNLSAVRPMMAASPLAALNAGILSAGSRFFALGGAGGLANGLPPTSSMLPKVTAPTPSLTVFSTPSSMPLVSPPSSSLTTAASLSKSAEQVNKPPPQPLGGLLMKAPSQAGERESNSGLLGISTSTSSPVKTGTPSPRKSQVTMGNDNEGVQDLSVKSQHQHEDSSQERRSVSTPSTDSEQQSQTTSDSLVISQQNRSTKEDTADQVTHPSSPQQDDTKRRLLPPPHESPLARHNSHVSECRTPPSISSPAVDNINDDASVMQDHYNADESDSNNEDDAASIGEEDMESRLSPTSKLMNCCENEKYCSHANQLTKLRKNVMRMLRCFAPEFSENNIDYSTVEVDQLLYDVMFSNMDEKILKK